MLLSAQVADLYFAYRTTQLRIVIARENAAIQKRSYEITERLYKRGQKSELDLQQAKTQYLATLSTIPQSEDHPDPRPATRSRPAGATAGRSAGAAGPRGQLPAIEPLGIGISRPVC